MNETYLIKLALEVAERWSQLKQEVDSTSLAWTTLDRAILLLESEAKINKLKLDIKDIKFRLKDF